MPGADLAEPHSSSFTSPLAAYQAPLSAPCSEESRAGNLHVRICGESKVMESATVSLYGHPGGIRGDSQGIELQPSTPSAYPTPLSIVDVSNAIAPPDDADDAMTQA